jgi:hypothetical protein
LSTAPNPSLSRRGTKPKLRAVTLLDKEDILNSPLLDKEDILNSPLLDKEGRGAVDKKNSH